MIDWRFLGILAGTTALLAGPAAPAVGRWDGGRAGLLAGALFTLASGAAGYHWLRWSTARSARAFFGAVMGVAAARVVAVVLFALGLAATGGANLAVALVALVALHLVFIGIEIVYLHRTGALE